MMTRKITYFIWLVISLPFFIACQANEEKPYQYSGIKIKGFSLVAPPKPFSKNPMPVITEVHANAISVIPYAFTPPGKPEVIFDVPGGQWWGEKTQGIVQTIHLAQEEGLSILLKPQLFIPGQWTGDLSFDKESEWAKWEQDYTKYIIHYAKIADSLGVEAFCIGTEFKQSVNQREAYWNTLIKKVKSIYNGTLTYAANWDEYESFPYWEKLDYIGINAYFPLCEDKTPSVRKLKRKWKPYMQKMSKIASIYQKPILFTEYGYLSVDQCALQPWEVHDEVHTYQTNEQAQANCLEALYDLFFKQTYWMGGYLWKWFPNGQGHEGYIPQDYTPQGKLAESIITHYFKNNH